MRLHHRRRLSLCFFFHKVASCLALSLVFISLEATDSQMLALTVTQSTSTQHGECEASYIGRHYITATCTEVIHIRTCEHTCNVVDLLPMWRDFEGGTFWESYPVKSRGRRDFEDIR